MKKILLTIFMCLICSASFADTRIPINQSQTNVTTASGGYKEFGNGINYQKDDNSFAEAVAQIVPSARAGIDWECYTTYNRVGFKNDITDGNYTVFSQIGNTGKILKSKVVGVAYLNIDTKEWEMIATPNSSTAVVNGNSIRYNNVFADADIEYVIEKSEFKQNWHINQKHLPVTPYPENRTAVVIVTKMDLANYELPRLIEEADEEYTDESFNDDGQTVREGVIRFLKQEFALSKAYDANNDEVKIRKRIVKKNGQYYLLEGIPYNWLDNAAYPVLFDYTTVSGASASDQTWSSGTYYISSTYTLAASHGLDVSGGVVIKIAAGQSITTASSRSDTMEFIGSAESRITVTSENDDTVGETISGSSGSPAASDWNKIFNSYTSANTFQYVDFNYGDHPLDFGAVGTQTIDNCTFKNGVTCIEHQNTYINVTNSHFDTFSGNCIQVEDTKRTGNVSHSVFTNMSGRTAYYITGTWDGVVVHDSTNGVIEQVYNTSGTVKNSLFYNLGGNAIASSNNGTINIYNNTFDNIGDATNEAPIHFWNSQGRTSNITDNIIMNSYNWIIYQTDVADTIDYNGDYNNAENVSSRTTYSQGANGLTADPNHETGTMAAGLFSTVSADYFLNQSTSTYVDAGSDTAANNDVDDLTTAIDKTLDSSTGDIGFHYEVDDVTAAASGRTRRFF